MNWFDKIYDEFSERNEAMFAFSRNQVEERGVDFDDFQRDWTSLGAGLHVKTSAVKEFTRRCDAALEEDQESLPVVEVTYVGTRFWPEYPAFRDDSGRILVDVEYGKPGTALVLHTVTKEGEPEAGLRARIVYK